MSEMPEEIWVYNHNGVLEARDVDIVVGNVKYIRADRVEALVEALERYYSDEICDTSIAEEALAAFKELSDETSECSFKETLKEGE